MKKKKKVLAVIFTPLCFLNRFFFCRHEYVSDDLQIWYPRQQTVCGYLEEAVMQGDFKPHSGKGKHF